MTLADNSVIRNLDEQNFAVGVDGALVTLPCLIMDKVVNDFDMIIGMDILRNFKDVSLNFEGDRCRVIFNQQCCSSISQDCNNTSPDVNVRVTEDDNVISSFGTVTEEESIRFETDDFTAAFEGEHWIIRWKWNKAGPPKFKKQVDCYKIPAEHQAGFDEEISHWIAMGWLRPATSVKATIPLMAVYHPIKNKVRPVLDFRHINSYVSSHTGESSVCQETLRKWRQMSGNIEMLDLEKAYLQIRVEDDLCQYQGVKYKGTLYQLTRLGFGLCSAPVIMSKILRKVLSLRTDIKEATDIYIDDIIVNTDKCGSETVVEHLSKYGLKSKSPTPLNGSRVLGLKVKNTDNGYRWSRSNEIPELRAQLTKRDVFSICGRLTGHYPVGNWLRIANQVNRSAFGCVHQLAGINS